VIKNDFITSAFWSTVTILRYFNLQLRMDIIPFGRMWPIRKNGSWRKKVWWCRLDLFGSECRPV